MGMPAPAYYTADMVPLPDDGNRYEVARGAAPDPSSPRLWHQEVAIRLLQARCEYLDREPVGPAAAARGYAGVPTSWCSSRMSRPGLRFTLDWKHVKDLLLVIEVLSPSSKRGDRFTKRRLYQEQGIPFYWIVDGDERVVEVWTPDARFPIVEREELVWRPVGATQAFTIELANLFRPI
jgi:hypothetical protein